MKCPKCDREISSLQNIVTGTMDYEFKIDDAGDEEYTRMEFEANGNENDFVCPLCWEVLFNNEEDAIAFLKGDISL